MDKIIIYSFVLISLYASTGFAQSLPANIRPLESSRKDVVKTLGDGKERLTQSMYDLKEERIRFTYYFSGCDLNLEKEMKLIRDAVLEIKVSLKTRKKVSDLIEARSEFDRFSYSDSNVFYVNWREGILVIGKIEGGIEYAQEIRYLPLKIKFPECVLTNLGDDSGLAIINRYEMKDVTDYKMPFAPFEVGGFFEEDSQAAQEWEMKRLADSLRYRENALGYVVLYHGEKDTSSKIFRRRENIRKSLKSQGITCDKLFYWSGSSGGLGGTQFYVVHKSYVAEQKLKPLCGNSPAS